MHQALSIPEVLTIVFHLLDEDDLFRCVMVCKKWMDAALDPLWREVDLWAILSTFPSFYRDMTDVCYTNALCRNHLIGLIALHWLCPAY